MIVESVMHSDQLQMCKIAKAKQGRHTNQSIDPGTDVAVSNKEWILMTAERTHAC